MQTSRVVHSFTTLKRTIDIALHSNICGNFHPTPPKSTALQRITSKTFSLCKPQVKGLTITGYFL